MSWFDAKTLDETLRQGREVVRRVIADVQEAAEEIVPVPAAPLVYRWPLTPKLEVELRFHGGEVTAEALERLQAYITLAKEALGTPPAAAARAQAEDMLEQRDEQ
jgi:hypothetical protein